jgi:RecB family exonuclease
MPSLFFAAAASALRGAALSSTELDRLVVEDDLDTLGLDDMIDRSERDRARMRSSGHEAEAVICAGAPHFRHSRDAGKKRWSNELSMYDGLVSPLPADLALKLDPATAPTPISASRLATFSKCGFMYVLQHVLRLQPAEEPEERKRLTPLERGDLFHRVAERFLRGERDEGRLPVKDTQPTRRRLLALADAALRGLVAGSPPRFSLLWERECEDFRRTMLRWLAREAGVGVKASPAYFEVSFGLGPSAEKEPHLEEPLEIDLGDGRLLRVSGRIDRIDRGADGTLVLRDYKTGKAPRDEGGVFRGGRQLQIPFYILAAARLFPEARVASTFLDYVDGGRQVSLDPGVVVAPSFAGLLRGMVDAIASGVFAQEPSACTFCDYTVVCGPQPLLERRKRHKIADPRLQRVLRLRDLG